MPRPMSTHHPGPTLNHYLRVLKVLSLGEIAAGARGGVESGRDALTVHGHGHSVLFISKAARQVGESETY